MLWVIIAYGLICAIALGFDLFTDRSFGALMLSVVPISIIALLCISVGPWLEGMPRFITKKAWLVGVLLVLVIPIGFSFLGSEQAKTGEMVFTYAAIIMALPSSLILPFVATWFEPLLGSNVVTRIVVAWFVCAGGGGLQWVILGWLYANVRRRLRSQAR